MSKSEIIDLLLDLFIYLVKAWFYIFIGTNIIADVWFKRKYEIKKQYTTKTTVSFEDLES